MKEPVAVVIPVYRSDLSGDEQRSLEQCLKVLGSHPIRLIGPESFDFRAFVESYRLPESVKMERFDDGHFRGIRDYNRLMLEPHFYKRFEKFERILIHQLDSWVFRDELLNWCRKGFDYIGGLWFEGFQGEFYSDRLLLPGNGGLSLRRVEAMRMILEKRPRLRDADWLTDRFLNPKFSFRARLRQRILFPLRLLGWRNRIGDEQWVGRINEDIFFAKVAPRRVRRFEVPSVEKAFLFSWDQRPEELFKRFGSLPFGCHGWSRDDGVYRGNRRFWAEILQKSANRFSEESKMDSLSA